MMMILLNSWKMDDNVCFSFNKNKNNIVYEEKFVFIVHIYIMKTHSSLLYKF